MKLYDRLIAGVVWLSKFTIFSPMNLQEDSALKDDLMQWGNYAIGNNMYPNLFNIFVKYSPTADLVLNRLVKYAFGNIPKEIKNQPTTLESSFTNTVQALVKNAGRDAFMYKGSFALWIGYNAESKVNEFVWEPVENVRYMKRDPELYPYTDNDYMLAILDSEGQKVAAVYYPYEPDRVAEQTKNFEAGRAVDPRLGIGQVLFYNSIDGQLYPDCVFNSMVPILLTDAGTDTMVMSYLANSDLLKTYKKKAGATGADTTNTLGGLFDGELLHSIWGVDRAVELGNTAGSAQFGSDYLNTGVKTAGSTEYVNITNDNEGINDYVKIADFPKFADELSKIDERVARKCCLALDVPYEYIFKMESGIMNQGNRAMLISELNNTLEDIRETFENVINKVLENSVYTWKLQIRPIGEGKEDVAEANKNIVAPKNEQ